MRNGRARRRVTELLQPASLEVIDDDAPAAARPERALGHGDAGLLMRDERLDEQTIAQRHVHDDADGRRAIEIDGLLGHALEEAAAEPVAAHGRNLHRLRCRRRRKTRPAMPARAIASGSCLGSYLSLSVL